MSKFLFLTGIFLASIVRLNAQSDSIRSNDKLMIGAQGGTTIIGVPWLSFDRNYLLSSRPFFDCTYGLSFQINLRKRLSFRAELNYEKISMNGTSEIQVSPSFKKSEHWAYSNEFITVPVTIKHDVVMSGRLRVFIEGGLFGSYFFRAYKSSSSDLPTDFSSESQNPRAMMLGVNFGTGMDIKLDSRMHLLIGSRHDIFSFCLRPIYNQYYSSSRFVAGISYGLK